MATENNGNEPPTDEWDHNLDPPTYAHGNWREKKKTGAENAGDAIGCIIVIIAVLFGVFYACHKCSSCADVQETPGQTP